MNCRSPSLGRHRRLAAPTILATLAVAMLAAPAAAVTPPSPSISAWVVARQIGTKNVKVTPPAMDQGNSTGGTNTVTRTGIGQYTVVLGGVSDPGGNVQVTPISGDPRWCGVDSWGTSVDGLTIALNCVQADGSDANSRFMLTYTVGTGSQGSAAGALAYLWSENTTPPATPSLTYQFSSAGGTITAARTGTGRYTITLPATGVTGGNVQITTYVGSVACRALDWAADGSTIHIACFTRAGVAADAVFDVLFLAKVGPEGYGGATAAGPAAYLWANKPTTASYQPTGANAYNSKGKTMSVLRGAKGNYTVVLTGMPAGGTVLVTPTGTGKAHCQLSSLGTVVPMKAIVKCTGPTGAPADSPFLLAYTK